LRHNLKIAVGRLPLFSFQDHLRLRPELLVLLALPELRALCLQEALCCLAGKDHQAKALRLRPELLVLLALPELRALCLREA
jgi:hypothetical protein